MLGPLFLYLNYIPKDVKSKVYLLMKLLNITTNNRSAIGHPSKRFRYLRKEDFGFNPPQC
jgi:hypothetical protein